jgi:hypothetical protein
VRRGYGPHGSLLNPRHVAIETFVDLAMSGSVTPDIRSKYVVERGFAGENAVPERRPRRQVLAGDENGSIVESGQPATEQAAHRRQTDQPARGADIDHAERGERANETSQRRWVSCQESAEFFLAQSAVFQMFDKTDLHCRDDEARRPVSVEHRVKLCRAGFPLVWASSSHGCLGQ